MTIFESIKNRIRKILGLEKISNPNDERLTYISNVDNVWKQHIQEYRVWYIGDSDELNNFYTARKNGGYAEEPIYNENKKQYFWALSEEETQGIKKIHTGVPRASINTLVNCLQDVKISYPENQEVLDKILEVNNFTFLLNQESRPLTLVEGDGAYKVVFDRDLCDYPLIQFYEAQDVDFIYKQGVLTGIIYKDYYKYQNKDYILLEIRRIENNNSIIEYELYRLRKSNEVEKVPLDTIPELSKLPVNGYCIEGVKKIMGVQSKFFHNILNKKRGMSIFAGKLDIADDMDMLASLESMTEQNSGPVEYYPVDLLKKDKNGKPELPKVFGRKFIKKPVVPSADGSQDGKIDTSAPDLNFQKYSDALTQKTLVFLSGLLSPASMGIDIVKKDNAEAQREKEKVTIMTRNNIKVNEEKQIKELMTVCLMLKEYMDTGRISIRDYDISVKYSDFASPTFETMSGVLVPMLTAGAISKEMFVEKLYGDSLSDDERNREIKAIEEAQTQENMDLGAILGNETSGNMESPRATEEESPEFAD